MLELRERVRVCRPRLYVERLERRYKCSWPRADIVTDQIDMGGLVTYLENNRKKVGRHQKARASPKETRTRTDNP